MNQSSSLTEYRELLKNSLLEIRHLRQQLATQTEAIAIIGLGCRFPGGANTPEAYWKLLKNGVDAITEIPSYRWNVEKYYDSNPDIPGKMYTRYGGFIDAVDQFDPQFFGISPREAISLDPQQRLLLEVSYTALEHAGQSPQDLRGSQTGVFIGICFDDYSRRNLNSGDVTRIDAFSSLGNTRSIAAGRIAYVLGLHGPTLQLDTTCSSSLLAVHLACQSLRNQECNLALAGGVNLMLSPEATIGFCKLKALAADGRCKTFDAKADGYSRGEGCGIVVLKRLSDAIANHDNILAVIRGFAVNHDGQSNGLTAPNGSAQEAVIRQALNNAKVKPEDIQYVEVHGTGTSLGDPIEVLALAKVLGENRSKNKPVYIGSVKTNFGHLESAAGVASLIKVVLSLQHQQIPPHLHFQQPNPYIPWDKIPVQVSQTLTPWQTETGQKLAGVSSFGMSGTNLHLILENAPTVDLKSNSIDRPLHLLTLSAKTEKALQELTESYHHFLASYPETSLTDICFTANTGRSHFDYRLAVVAESHQQLSQTLANFVDQKETPSLFNQTIQTKKQPKIAFLFTGQGSQYEGMAQQLYRTQPTFRNALNHCAEILQPQLDIPLLDLLYSPSSQHLIHQTIYTQPALFAVEYALFQLWNSWGIQPDILIGHSLGEYVAACVAGVFSLEAGLKLVATRARLIQQLPQTGEMVVVFASVDTVKTCLESYQSCVEIAVINSPTNTVISGETQAINPVVEFLNQQGYRTQFLTVSHAFHSQLIEPMIGEFRQAAEQIQYHQPQIDMVSNVTGNLAAEEIATAEYWCHHLRQSVQFASGIETLDQAGIDIFVELGPKPTLVNLGQSCLIDSEKIWLGSLTPKQENWQTLLSSLSQLYVAGVEVNWLGFDQDYSRQRVALPTMAFQRQRYWQDSPEIKPNQTHQNIHPLLGNKVNLAKSKIIHFESKISQNNPAFLQEHRIFDEAVFPASAYIEMALSAGKQANSTGQFYLEDVVLHQAMILPGNKEKTIQLILTPQENQSYRFEIYSCQEGTQVWENHASGKLILQANTVQDEKQLNLQAAEKGILKAVEALYQNYQNKGISYGDCFQIIDKIYQRLNGEEKQVFAHIKASEIIAEEQASYHVHPILLDACFQAVGAAFSDEKLETYLPVSFQQIIIQEPLDTEDLWSQVKLNQTSNPKVYFADILISNSDGKVLAEITQLQIQAVSREAVLGKSKTNLQDWLYTVAWKPQPLSLPVTNFEVSIPAITDNLVFELSQFLSQPQFKRYGELLPQLEDLSVSYIIQALREMGFEFKAEQQFSPQELVNNLGIQIQHQRLFQRLLDILSESGILRKRNQVWEVIPESIQIDSPSQIQTQLSQHSEISAELSILTTCGSQLAQVLQGKCDPIQLLFPSGDVSLLTQLYQNSPGAKVMNTLVEKVIQKALDNQSQNLKILEIGAGTGGTTAYILPHLEDKKVEYVFTDVSPLFTTKAQQKFQDYSFIRYQVLDIEKDPNLQGYKAESYHLIIAANVLHATADLRQTLVHVQQLLAPGGMLVLLEGTEPSCWLDLIFGLTEGWWKFSDENLRTKYPLISVSQWHNLLSENGFEQITPLVPSQFNSNLFSQQAVIVAQKGLNQLVGNTLHKHWLILADRQGVGQKLAESLQAVGEPSILVFSSYEYQQLSENEFQIDANNDSDYSSLFKTLNTRKITVKGVVNLWSLENHQVKNLSSEELKIASRLGWNSTLNIVQSLVKTLGSELPNLWLVTRESISTGENASLSGIVQSPVWGIGKVIALEHPEIKCIRIDLDAEYDIENQAEIILKEINENSNEDQIAWRHNTRLVARLARSNQSDSQDILEAINEPYQLTVSQRGTLENLKIQPSPRRQPKAKEVEIQVKATGLNFRDILNTLGLYPGDAGLLGCECAGEIIRIGDEVEGLNIGDAVIAIASGSFSQFVTVDAAMVAAIPNSLSFEEAATIPVTFLTAYYTLNYLAKMKKGDKILIHAAAGGVGQAALQLAQQAGAEVFATASPGKWEFLKSLGIQHIMNSRTLEFADEIMQQTQGEGVDIVLNSLSGEFVDKSFSVLKNNGRFVEIGKTGLTREQVDNIKPNASYFQIDLVEQCHQQPDVIQLMLQHLMQQFQAGNLRPLPRQVFPLQKAKTAFRQMQQAKHIGKIVISNSSIRGDGTYLITGGLGGLGLRLASWLVEKGAKHLVLVSRRSVSSEIQTKITQLEQAGVQVLIAQADVSDYNQVTDIWQNIEENMPPLTGIFHAAGVLNDGVLMQLNRERFERVMAPKIQGAWNLHLLSQNQPLDLFILFSSATALFGSPGQANHVAANTFLDTLARYRHSLGLAGLSINWGAWSDIGAAANKAQANINLSGMGMIAPTQGLEILEQLIIQPLPQVGVIPIDWSQFLQGNTKANINTPFLTEFSSDYDLQQPEKLSSWLPQIQQAALKNRRAVLEKLIRGEISKVLGFKPTELDMKTGFFDLGMDSLTSVELKNRLQVGLGCSLPSTVAFDYPTTEALIDYLESIIPIEFKQEIVKIAEPIPEDLEIESTAELSEDEIADKLDKKLADIEKFMNLEEVN